MASPIDTATFLPRLPCANGCGRLRTPEAGSRENVSTPRPPNAKREPFATLSGKIGNGRISICLWFNSVLPLVVPCPFWLSRRAPKGFPGPPCSYGWLCGPGSSEGGQFHKGFRSFSSVFYGFLPPIPPRDNIKMYQVARSFPLHGNRPLRRVPFLWAWRISTTSFLSSMQGPWIHLCRFNITKMFYHCKRVVWNRKIMDTYHHLVIIIIIYWNNHHPIGYIHIKFVLL